MDAAAYQSVPHARKAEWTERTKLQKEDGVNACTVIYTAYWVSVAGPIVLLLFMNKKAKDNFISPLPMWTFYCY